MCSDRAPSARDEDSSNSVNAYVSVRAEGNIRITKKYEFTVSDGQILFTAVGADGGRLAMAAVHVSESAHPPLREGTHYYFSLFFDNVRSSRIKDIKADILGARDTYGQPVELRVDYVKP